MASVTWLPGMCNAQHAYLGSVLVEYQQLTMIKQHGVIQLLKRPRVLNLPR